MSEFVLDASAVLAFINQEAGASDVEDVLHRSVISTINLTEVFSKLVREGMDVEETRSLLSACCPHAVSVDRDQAETAAVIHAATARKNVSYADSVCLALGACRNLPIVTADKKWKTLDLGMNVELKFLR